MEDPRAELTDGHAGEGAVSFEMFVLQRPWGAAAPPFATDRRDDDGRFDRVREPG